MHHAIYRVLSFEVVAPYTLRVRFDDSTEQTINFQPVLSGDLYAPLNEQRLFNQVSIDPEVHTVVWPNGADFDPATLHDWPLVERAFVDRARHWQPIQARSLTSDSAATILSTK